MPLKKFNYFIFLLFVILSCKSKEMQKNVEIKEYQENTLSIKEQNNKIKENFLSYNLWIPDVIIKTIHQWNKEFILWQSKDYTAEIFINTRTTGFFSLGPESYLSRGIGDFNNDGILDAVVVGHIDDNEIVLSVLSNKEGNYTVYPVCADREENFKVAANYNACYDWPLGSGLPPWKNPFKNSPSEKIKTPLLVITNIVKKGAKLDGCIGDMNCKSFLLKSDGFVISRRYIEYLKDFSVSITHGILYILDTESNEPKFEPIQLDLNIELTSGKR